MCAPLQFIENMLVSFTHTLSLIHISLATALRTAQAQESQTARTRTVFVDASGRKPNRLEPGIALREGFRDLAGERADLEYVVSWFCLHRLGIGIEFANQGLSIFLC